MFLSPPSGCVVVLGVAVHCEKFAQEHKWNFALQTTFLANYSKRRNFLILLRLLSSRFHLGGLDEPLINPWHAFNVSPSGILL